MIASLSLLDPEFAKGTLLIFGTFDETLEQFLRLLLFVLLRLPILLACHSFVEGDLAIETEVLFALFTQIVFYLSRSVLD